MALSRNEIKLIKSLQEKSGRETHQRFVVEGVKLVQELFSQRDFTLDCVYYTEEYDAPLPQGISSVKIPYSDLERISGLITPNKILAVVHLPVAEKPNYSNAEFVLILDEIKDPGNLGTILRTADWFGIKTVIASETTVDLFNPKVIQASMGAIYRIQFSRQNLAPILEQLKKENFDVLGADMQGESLTGFQFSKKTALVMGSESHGISAELRKLLSKTITIPKFGETESLNVGIAAAIILAAYRN